MKKSQNSQKQESSSSSRSTRSTARLTESSSTSTLPSTTLQASSSASSPQPTVQASLAGPSRQSTVQASLAGPSRQNSSTARMIQNPTTINKNLNNMREIIFGTPCSVQLVDLFPEDGKSPPTDLVPKKCALCKIEDATHAFVPCGHKVICEDCLKGSLPKVCCKCRREINSVFKIYD